MSKRQPGRYLQARIRESDETIQALRQKLIEETKNRQQLVKDYLTLQVNHGRNENNASRG